MTVARIPDSLLIGIDVAKDTLDVARIVAKHFFRTQLNGAIIER